MNSHLGFRMALPFALFLGVAEVVRNWGDWGFWPFWVVDYIAVALLVWGWRPAGSRPASSVAVLAGAWGFTCAIVLLRTPGKPGESRPWATRAAIFDADHRDPFRYHCSWIREQSEGGEASRASLSGMRRRLTELDYAPSNKRLEPSARRLHNAPRLNRMSLDRWIEADPDATIRREHTPSRAALWRGAVGWATAP